MNGNGRAGGVVSLTEILDEVIAASPDDATVESLLRAFGERGLGVFLVLACTLIMLPFGLFPGFQVVMGAFMVVVVMHMLLGQTHLRLPAAVMRKRLPAARLRNAMEWLRPIARRLDRWRGPRLARLADNRLMRMSAALVSLFLSGVIMAVGLLPGVPALLSVPVLLYGLGMILRSGLFLLAGHVVAAMLFLAVLLLV